MVHLPIDGDPSKY